MTKIFKTAFIALVTALFLAGCVNSSGGYKPPVVERSDGPKVVQSVEPATTPVDVSPGIVVESKSDQAVAVPVPTPMSSRPKNPAVLALLDNASKQKSSGQMQAAESSLERAQRIAPRDPEIYFQLSDIRRLEGQWAQAEQLALKGTNMAIGDVIMQRRLWLLIADIRAQSGNHAAARKARQQALQY
ncbi:MAG: tetratricopeptide repeat protein [Neptuniibacter sp.]